MFDKAPPAEQAEMPAGPAPAKESVLIFGDNAGYSQRLLAAAPEGRIGMKKIVDKWEDLTEDDVGKLISSQKGGWDMVVFMAGINAPGSNHVDNVIDQGAVVSKLFLYVLRQLQHSENVRRLAVITRGCHTEDAKQHHKYGLGMITNAVLFGMCNSARQELEDVPVQYVDTEWSLKGTGEEDKYKLFPRLASEIFRMTTFGHNSTRILNKGRFVLREVHVEQYAKAGVEFEMPTKGTIAISGGNGALALVMGGWLLEQAEKSSISGIEIKFLSRSCKISDLNMPTWIAIQEKAKGLGIIVEQAKCDMSTQAACDKFISELTPNLMGFIHSAGVLQDSMLMNLTWEKCEAVFNSKHRPAMYLHSALERYSNPGLKFFWMFSSVAVWGNMGQINYSGSNAFLDALCRHRRGKGLPACGMQWGAWGEVGMAATMSDSMRARTMSGPCPYFSNAEGIRGMEDGLRTGLPGFSVFKFNPAVMFPMTNPDHSANACQSRNWWCEITPQPGTGDLSKNGIYSALRTNIGYYHDKKFARMIYDTYSKPLVDKCEDEWGDDFRKWEKVKI